MKKGVGSTADEMRVEYKRSDFKKLERGKFYEKLVASSNVVVLEPRVAKAFPNSARVNQVLSSLLELAHDQRADTPGTLRVQAPFTWASPPALERERSQAAFPVEPPPRTDRLQARPECARGVGL